MPNLPPTAVSQPQGVNMKRHTLRHRRRRRPKRRDTTPSFGRNWSERLVRDRLQDLCEELVVLGYSAALEYEPEELATDLPRRGGEKRGFRPDFRLTLTDVDALLADPTTPDLVIYFEVTQVKRGEVYSDKRAKIRSVKRRHQTQVVLIAGRQLTRLLNGERIECFLPAELREEIERRQAAYDDMVAA